MSEIGEPAEKILTYGPICDHCLGRLFGKRSFGLSNAERGRAIRIVHALENNQPFAGEPDECWVCNRLFDDIGAWAESISDALSDIEFSTFLVGCRVPPLMAESEEMVWSDLALSSPEPLKAEFNREVGKVLAHILKRDVDFQRPDVVTICDIAAGTVEVQIKPVFLYGRYWKYERGIPQTRWHCRVCRGAGCERCHFTGKMYADSVEELIARPVIAELRAQDAILHGAGREDIDARMLGSGRPFILEVVAPKVRTAELRLLEDLINRSSDGRVQVMFDHRSARSEVETIKSQKAHKKYSISVEVENAFSIEDIQNAVNALQGVTITQRTPLRVSHRRADRLRKRRVIEMECAGRDDDRFLIEVVGEAGLYIKELISGDGGRTTPSLAEILGVSARVVTLDVIMVESIIPEPEINQRKSQVQREENIHGSS